MFLSKYLLGSLGLFICRQHCVADKASSEIDIERKVRLRPSSTVLLPNPGSGSGQ